MARVTKKIYAALMTAKDDTRLIIDLQNKMDENPVNNAMEEIRKLGQDLKVTNAYKTAQAMAEIAAKYLADPENAHATAEAMSNHAKRWLADFEDANPLWRPTNQVPVKETQTP